MDGDAHERAWLRPGDVGRRAAALIGWASDHETRVWILRGLVTIGAVFLSTWSRIRPSIRHDTKLGRQDLVLADGNGLGAFLAVCVLLEHTSLAWIPYAGLVLAALHAVVGRQIRLRDLSASLHAMAVAFSLLAAVVAVQLDGAWLTAAWSAEGAAVVLIGVWMGQTWFRTAGAALFTVAVWRWLAFTVPSVPSGVRSIPERDLTARPVAHGAPLYVMAWAHHKAQPSLAYRRDSVATLLVAASIVTTITLTVQSESSPAAAGCHEPRRHVRSRNDALGAVGNLRGAAHVLWDPQAIRTDPVLSRLGASRSRSAGVRRISPNSKASIACSAS